MPPQSQKKVRLSQLDTTKRTISYSYKVYRTQRWSEEELAKTSSTSTYNILQKDHGTRLEPQLHQNKEVRVTGQQVSDDAHTQVSGRLKNFNKNKAPESSPDNLSSEMEIDDAEEEPESYSEVKKSSHRAGSQDERSELSCDCLKLNRDLEGGLCYEYEISRLRAELKASEGERNYLWEALSAASTTNNALKIQLRHADTEAGNWKEMFHQSDEIWTQKYTKLEDRFHKNEIEIGRLQRTELAITSRKDVLLDEQAKQDLKDIFPTKVAGIARPLFRKIPWKHFSGFDTQDLDKIFGEMFEYPWTLETWAGVRTHSDFNITTMVDALVSCTLTNKIFKDPFFLYGYDPTTQMALQKVYSLAIQQDPVSAEAWRASTASITQSLNDTQFQQSRTKPPLQKIASALSLALVELFAVHHRPAKSEIGFINDKVEELVLSSAKLASTWHTRDFRLEIIDIFWLQTRKMQWDSEDADKYVSHFKKKQILKERASYYIVAVISPGFIRYEKGNEHDEPVEIVWERASVLLAEA
ncbi:hypothetical protein TWF694_000194 [Orbilia ellipsospora]|uniref:Uncharacterized protein n=1 Tax=Orbilia ellipsospora TaxID=2528407 RepID=A0AAV9XPG7_9PEZI